MAPLPRPETGDRADNSLVPGPVRGPYDYQAEHNKLGIITRDHNVMIFQGGLVQRYTNRGWAARYVDQVWGEQGL